MNSTNKNLWHKHLLCGISLLIILAVGSCATISPKLSSFRSQDAEISLSVTSEDRQKERIIRNQIISLGDKTSLRAQVKVHNNQAILVGEVLNKATKESLEVSAIRNAKVDKVFNLIDVSNPLPEYKGFTDLLLKTKVAFAMAGVKELDTTRVETVVDRQRIFLMGVVTEDEASIMVERLRRISGVKEIVVVFKYI